MIYGTPSKKILWIQRYYMCPCLHCLGRTGQVFGRGLLKSLPYQAWKVSWAEDDLRLGEHSIPKHQAYLPCSYSSRSIWLWVLNVYYYHVSSPYISSTSPLPLLKSWALVSSKQHGLLACVQKRTLWLIVTVIKSSTSGHAFLIISCRSLEVRDRVEGQDRPFNWTSTALRSNIQL